GMKGDSKSADPKSRASRPGTARFGRAKRGPNHSRPNQEGRLDPKPPRELHRCEVDGRVPLREKRDRHPRPRRRQNHGPDPPPPPRGTEQAIQDRDARERRRGLRRPDRRVVELEEPVVGSGRKEEEVGEAVGPPLRHQSFSTYSTMRRRIASSGSLPYDAPRFSRTWSAREVAGIAPARAGCETMNLSRSCGHPEQPISAAKGGSGFLSNFWISSPRRNGRLQITAAPRSRASGRSRLSASRSRTL